MVMAARALHAAEPNASIWLLLPGAPLGEKSHWWSNLRHVAKNVVKAMVGRPRIEKSPEGMQAEAAGELVVRIRDYIPKIEIRYMAGIDRGLAEAATELRLDAVCYLMRLPKRKPACALVGYVPDYQHRYLPHLFSEKEVIERDLVFNQLIAGSDAMILNAQAVAEDVGRFATCVQPPLNALPFTPNLDPEWLQDRPDLMAKYGIKGPYFIICNQFWVHKDHTTAFRAFAEIIRKRPDIAMICTGGTVDYRAPRYLQGLKAETAKLGLDAHLRFLGHIPKRDQIELLKHAVALIQPTLFEGGPGGGSAYEAVALGKRVIISDIPVNREIDSGDVRFFGCGDYVALSELMEKALSEAPASHDSQSLEAKSAAMLRRNGEALWASLRCAVNRYLNSR